MKKRGNWKKLIGVFVITCFFLFGWYANVYYKKSAIELNWGINNFSSSEKPLPLDRVKDGQILVYDSMVVLNISNVEWSKYDNTNSMNPLLDETSNGLEIKPETEDDIIVGDIIIYRPNWTIGLIIHRVISIEEDRQGKYYVVKGDNSQISDPEKVRFSQVEGVLLGILY